MKVLLDSHALLWWCSENPQLSALARGTIEEQECIVSMASLWEMAIKVNLGKLTLPDAIDRYFPEQMLRNGFGQLDIGIRHIARYAALPLHHRDPFDRMLTAQAIEDNLVIVSRDPVFTRYGVERIW